MRIGKTLALRPGRSEKWFHEFVTGYGSVCLTDAGQAVKLPPCDYVLAYPGSFRMSADIFYEEKKRLAKRGISNPTWCKGVAVAKTLVLQKLGRLA